MTDSAKRVRLGLIIALVGYAVSLLPWLIWFLALLIGSDHTFPLLTLAWLVTSCYPVVILVCLLFAWRLYRQTQLHQATFLLLVPLLYVPIMVLLGFVALWQVG